MSSSSASHLAERAAARPSRSPTLAGDRVLATATRDLAAHVIGQPPHGDLIEPAARIVGNALARPLRRRGDQRLLHGIFGGGEVAVATRDGAEHLRREIAQQVPDRRVVESGAGVTASDRAARSSPVALRWACSAARRRVRAPPTLARRSRTRAPGVSTSTIQ